VARKDSSRKLLVILTSVESHFKSNLAALGENGMVSNKGVLPERLRAFGSAPASRGSSTKSRLVTMPEVHAWCNGVLPCGLDTALTLAPHLISSFAWMSCFHVLSSRYDLPKRTLGGAK
jgi:hypothetical protein